MPTYPPVVADHQFGGVDVVGGSRSSEQADEQHYQWLSHLAHEFDKAVVANEPWEVGGKLRTDIAEVVVFESFVIAPVEPNNDRQYLT